MFSPIDIHEELIKAKQKHQQRYALLNGQVQAALKQGKQADEYIVNRLRNAPKPGKSDISTETLEKNRVFSVDDIKTVCTNYRLRFLDSKYFKMEELPDDTLTIIKNVEKYSGKDVRQIQIMGMDKFFKSEEKKKIPVLFARIDETNYYFVHNWEKNFAWYNKILAYPFRSIQTLLLSFTVIGLPLAIFIPLLLFHTAKDVHYYEALYLAGFTVSFIFITVFGGFTFHKNFSRKCWDNPFFH